MKKSLRLLVAVGASSVVISALASAPVVADESAGQKASNAKGVARAAKLVPLLAAHSTGARTYVGPARTGTRGLPAKTGMRAATFNVTYHGFTPAARTAFQSAVNIWKTRVTSSVPITVDATFQPLGPGILGSAGPNFLWRDFSGRPLASTFYVDAIANKRHGSQMDPSPDIVANFNSDFSNWYLGTDGNTPNNFYDFKTVVLHELGHGLGFLGAGRVGGGVGSVRLGNPAFPTAYDRFTEDLAGRRLTTFPNNSVTLANKLQNNNVYFDSVKVRNANGNKRARLYAPNPFQGGSSYSHLNEATYPAGNPHSLMTPQLSDGEAIHTPGAITMALFKSIGW